MCNRNYCNIQIEKIIYMHFGCLYRFGILNLDTYFNDIIMILKNQSNAKYQL